MDIIMVKWVAPKGTARLVFRHKEALEARFPAYLLEEIAEEGEAPTDICRGLCPREAVIYAPVGVGLAEALWELGELMASGFVVYYESLPIHQMSVEVCEYLGEDLLALDMEGSLLIGCEDGPIAVRELSRAGIRAAIIGHTHSPKARMIKDRERETYIRV